MAASTRTAKTEPKPEKAVLAPAPATPADPENIKYPEGLRHGLLMISVFISLFLISLDRLILATAITQITNDFFSAKQMGWYGSAYLSTSCTFQLLFGKLYGYFSIKGTFLVSLVFFELGSALCGLAPSSTFFVVGRAFSGLGAAGIMAGAFVIVIYALPPEKRPMYQGLIGVIFGASSALGPLIGGAFTGFLTWRWCFYINLPLVILAILVIIFLLEVPYREEMKLPLKDKILQLDLAGTSVLLPGTLFLLLALEWGGSVYPWDDGYIIALLVISIVLLIAFVLVQASLPKTAAIPPRVFKQRSVAAAAWCALWNGSSTMIFVYFIPIWLQVVKGESAWDSGAQLLALCLPMVASSIVTGSLTTKIGYFTPFLIIGTCIMAVGASLFTTVEVDTDDRMLIGFQVLYGWGAGMVLQAPNLAAQTTLPMIDVPIGLAMVMFVQLLGSAVLISVGQSIFSNRFVKLLNDRWGINPGLFENSGLTTLFSLLPETMRPVLLDGFNEALRCVFIFGLAVTALALLGTLAMEWTSLKQPLPVAQEVAAEEGNNERSACGELRMRSDGDSI